MEKSPEGVGIEADTGNLLYCGLNRSLYTIQLRRLLYPVEKLPLKGLKLAFDVFKLLVASIGVVVIWSV